MKEEKMSELMQVLEEWRNGVPLKSSIEKTYEIDGNVVTLTLLVSCGGNPTKDKSFICTCEADISSVKNAINKLEKYKASSLKP